MRSVSSVNVIVQRLGAQMYSDGIRHSLDLPYQVFEDQRSGETLGKLQKVRTDTERFIAALVNLVFTTLVGTAAAFRSGSHISVTLLLDRLRFTLSSLLRQMDQRQRGEQKQGNGGLHGPELFDSGTPREA